jgi:hypothetical protein
MLSCVIANIPAHIDPTWVKSPASTPSNDCVDGPILGNGALGVAVGSAHAGGLTFYIDRNDAWVPATGDISMCGYDTDHSGGRTVGQLQLEFDGGLPAQFGAKQLIQNATVTTSQSVSLGGFLRTSSFVPRGVDVLVTELWWEFNGTGSLPSALLDVKTAAAQGPAGGDFCHSFDSGVNVSTRLTWASRQIGWPYQNVNTSTIGRRHFYKAAWATASTATSAPALTDNVPAIGRATSGDDSTLCADFDGCCTICNFMNDTRPDWASPCIMLNSSALPPPSPLRPSSPPFAPPSPR